jgi:hypothetical protein
MIHNERVRHMVQLQAFNDKEGKICFPITRYFRKDYVWLHVLKAFVCGTVCYAILLFMWGVSNMEILMNNIHTMDLQQFAVNVLLRYLAFLGLYILCVFIYAQMAYSRARREVKKYNRHLKKVIAGLKGDGGDT